VAVVRWLGATETSGVARCCGNTAATVGVFLSSLWSEGKIISSIRQPDFASEPDEDSDLEDT
jgi:hypothetical protein